MESVHVTLRYNFQAGGWELVDDATSRVHALFHTRTAALASDIVDLLFAPRGGVLCIRGSDGCFESERRYPPALQAVAA
ncbi:MULTISPECIES: DUF2188 domain-containing protein [Luteimonas]|uniref:DUF2188 domain-containing protein n=1 Tax=Luteimonas TaxID=83614 RepID=UPI000C7C9AD0|nr:MULTISPECIES: DUF2188 domain-containing protein [Luteimonas]